MEPLRIHFAGLGYREVDRAIQPLHDLRADVVYLLAHHSEALDGRASAQREEAKRRLEGSGIQVHVEFTDLWDSATVASTVRTIMRREVRHEYRFNVATGPKPCVIGGFMASMFWPVKLYYVEVDYKHENKGDSFSQYPPSGVRYLPTFKANPPRKKAVEALQLLGRENWRLAQNDFSKALQRENVVRPAKQDAEFTPQAAHSQVQSIIDSLLALGFIERYKAGVTFELVVTPEGRSACRLFNLHIDELR